MTRFVTEDLKQSTFKGIYPEKNSLIVVKRNALVHFFTLKHDQDIIFHFQEKNLPFF